METVAVIFEEPQRLSRRPVELTAPNDDDIVVDVCWSGISTGTEKLLWSGKMPPFPGMGYPLIPGYESVGEVVEAGPKSGHAVGDLVFVPGAQCYTQERGLFGGAASRLVSKGTRALSLDRKLQQNGVLLALAATAHHALNPHRSGNLTAPALPDLVVGHGVLGRLIARVSMALGGSPPTVWEREPARQDGASGYAVTTADADERRDYSTIIDVTGDGDILDSLINRLTPGGEVVLAGFYDKRPNFGFPSAFMREARLRIAAEWKSHDLTAVRRLIDRGSLSLNGLITHTAPSETAADAYETAFSDPACLKMVMDWRTVQ